MHILAAFLALATAAAPVPETHPTKGPATIDLGHDLQLQLPENHVFFGPEDANKLMEYMGNPHSDLIGLVARRGEDWLVTVRFEDVGYVKDDEAAKLDAKEILESITEGTAEANKYRREHGGNEIRVVGWAEPPRYEQGVHHVVWAVEGKTAQEGLVNFNTRVLGRRGVASLNLITQPAQLGATKPRVEALLAATSFKPGARYEDFEKQHDKVAEFGLAALVAGGAGAAALKVAKIGLLAKFGKAILALLIAGKKLLVVGAVAAWAFIKRLLGMKKKDEEQTELPPPEAPPAV